MTEREADRVRAQYDAAAPGYLEHQARVNRYAARVSAFLEANVREGQRWLDVGCGPGNLTGALAESVDVVGIDLSPEMIRLAKTRRASGTYLVHDFHEPLPDEVGLCHGAISVSCFEFCQSPHVALDNLARHLVPGALLLFSIVERRAELEHQSDRSILANTDQGDVRIYCWSFEETASAITAAGLVPVSYEFGPGWIAGHFEGAMIHYGWWTVRRPGP